MGRKNAAGFPKTKGSKPVGYIKAYGPSRVLYSKKCRLTRKEAKEQAILEHKNKKTMSVADQEREKAARTAAELQQKAHNIEQSKRMKKLMAARQKKEKLERRLHLQKLRKARIAKMNMDTDHLWKKNGAQYIQWYLKSFERSPKPVHFMTAPTLLDPLDCKCQKKSQVVDLYMLHLSGHEQVTIQHCDCRGLVEALLLMQMIPSSSVTPRTGIHFGLLDYLHLLKMGSQVSNQAFTDITNQSIAMSQHGPKKMSTASVA
ncbi:hypothetical protein V8B55DRAFT_1161729 [Mucor lusitanicus]